MILVLKCEGKQKRNQTWDTSSRMISLWRTRIGRRLCWESVESTWSLWFNRWRSKFMTPWGWRRERRVSYSTGFNSWGLSWPMSERSCSRKHYSQTDNNTRDLEKHFHFWSLTARDLQQSWVMIFMLIHLIATWRRNLVTKSPLFLKLGGSCFNQRLLYNWLLMDCLTLSQHPWNIILRKSQTF